ncbi:MAG TPA: polysaccharide deacetylase family protein [Vicinamibacterales bacterium]|jgi:peptidoglycan/xylan/chitin deacetylase (PgdA/CDA1 family)
MLIWFLAIGFSAVFLAHTAPFPFLLEAFKPGKSLWRVKPGGGPPTVYLTYDDGPNPAATPALLDVLARERARATFFLIDAHLTDETAFIVKRMFAEGHAVALHADTRQLMLKSPADLSAFLVRNADRIERLGGGIPCRLFRPHAGWRSGQMYAGLERAGYRLAGWSWGLWDWNWYRGRDPEALAARLTKRVSPGDIVVMHDGHHVDPRADRRYAVEATAKLVPALRAKGYHFRPLCE